VTPASLAASACALAALRFHARTVTRKPASIGGDCVDRVLLGCLGYS
jgi:hypothetical protein